MVMSTGERLIPTGPQVQDAPEAVRVRPDEWTERDRVIVGKAPGALAGGAELLRWWRQIDAAKAYTNRFNLIRQFNWSDSSFGFFETAPLAGDSLPVMGIVEELTYDRAQSTSPERVHAEFREFILHYFM